MKKKKLIISLIVVAVVLGLIATVLISGVKNYIDTHSWATIAVNGVYNKSDIADAFYDQQECLQGDRISMGSVILEITDITHEGTVTFKVLSGEVQDETGNIINKDTLGLRIKKEYRIPEGNMQLEVVSNRYE